MTSKEEKNFLLTEKYLLKITQSSDLSEIEELQLHNLDLIDEDLKPEVFNKLINLTEINFSGNKLTCIPNDITLNSLQYLDISRNCLKDVEFFTRFPGLKDLDIADNIGLTIEDSYKVLFLLKNLQFLNGKRVENNDKLGKNFTIELLKRIKRLWLDKFNHLWQLQNDDKNKLILLKNFASSCEARIRYGPNSLKNYRKWRIKNITSDLIYSKPTDPSFFLSNSITEINLNSKDYNLDERANKRKSSSIDLSSSHKKKVHRNLKADLNNLDINFKPLIFLQCHSKDQGPNDFSTQIWCCAFQPNSEKLCKTTRTVATCGGSSVNIINCETAKVIASFKQDNEEFYTLAWSCVLLNGYKTNLLVAAGCLGFLHLIHVDQAICYGRIKAHSAPVQTIRFLSSSSTFLLSGDKKGNIFLIDIDTPIVPEYKFTWKKLICFIGVEWALLRFLVKDNFLFSGTEAGLYFWSEQHLFETSSSIKKISCCRQILFPGAEENEIVDAIELLNDDTIATKCANQSEIFLWKHSVLCSQLKTATLKKQKFEVSLIAKLAWSATAQCFINFSICRKNNFLLVGDDVGKLWIYDLTSFVKLKSFTSCVLLQPKIIIPFPLSIQANKFQQNKTIYNDVDCTSDLHYVVVATDNNMVGIFKKCID